MEIESITRPEFWYRNKNTNNPSTFADAIGDTLALYDFSRFVFQKTENVISITDMLTGTTLHSLTPNRSDMGAYIDAMSLLLAPPTKRHLFERTVHSYVLKDANYAPLYTQSAGQLIARTASHAHGVSLERLPIRNGIAKNVNTALDVIHTGLTILSSHLTKHIHDINPSPLLRDPMIRVRVWAYSHFGRSIPNIFRDGIEGQLELTHVLINGLVRQIYTHRKDLEFHPSQTPHDIFHALIDTMESNAFVRSLISLTSAPNGLFFPTVREHPESFNVWDVSGNEIRILPSYLQKIHTRLHEHNAHINEQFRSPHVIYRSSIDDQTSDGCPAAKAAFVPCFDPFDVSYLPVEREDIDRVKLQSPIVQLHTFVCTTLREMHLPADSRMPL